MRFLPLIFLLIADLAAAQDPVSDAIKAVETLDRAAADLAGIDGSDDRVVALTSVVRAFEEALAVLRQANRQARQAREAADAAFAEDSQHVSQLLGALQAAGAPTTAGRLLHPSGPVGSARAAMLMAEVLPALDRESQSTKREWEDLATLERAITETEIALRAGAQQARMARLQLATALRQNDATADPMREGVQNALAQAGRSLEDLALMLAESPVLDAMEPGNRFEDQLGVIPPPVDGAVVRAFSAGSERPGVTLATPPRALVSFAHAAEVRFRGTLAGYGNVIILEPAPGYLVIFTGVHEPLVRTSQSLPPGSALGLMGGTEEEEGVSDRDSSELLTETLYIEVRANGDVSDPATWFALD